MRTARTVKGRKECADLLCSRTADKNSYIARRCSYRRRRLSIE